MLGGFDPRVPCYAGGIDLDLSVDALLRQTDDNLARGFRAIKLKVGRPSLREDIERVRAMRAHLGAEFSLMVDANMRWSVDEAIRAARALAECDPVWLEEPTSPEDVPGHVRIVREGGLPIAAGENLHTLAEFRQLIAAGGVTFPEPDVTNCGGVTVFMKICHLAEAFCLPVTSHGAHDVTVHLLAAAPNRSAYALSTWGRSNSGSTVKLTSTIPLVPMRSCCRWAMVPLTCEHGPAQRVKMKAATQVFPKRSVCRTLRPLRSISEKSPTV